MDFLISSLFLMFSRCFSTVRGLMKHRLAISFELSPLEIKLKTSFSRFDKEWKFSSFGGKVPRWRSLENREKIERISFTDAGFLRNAWAFAAKVSDIFAFSQPVSMTTTGSMRKSFKSLSTSRPVSFGIIQSMTTSSGSI